MGGGGERGEKGGVVIRMKSLGGAVLLVEGCRRALSTPWGGCFCG